MKIKYLGTLALGVVVGAVLAAGPLEASSKQTIPSACREAILDGGDVLNATDELVGNINDRDHPPENSLLGQAISALDAGDSAAVSVVLGTAQARTKDLWDAESNYDDNVERCGRKVKGI